MSNIKEIIDTWDPIGLFPFCPENEYHSEILQIEAFLCEPLAEKDLGEYIFALFTDKVQTSLDKGTQRKTTENELPSLTQCTA